MNSLVKMCYKIECEYLDQEGKCHYEDEACPYICQLIRAKESQNSDLE